MRFPMRGAGAEQAVDATGEIAETVAGALKSLGAERQGPAPKTGRVSGLTDGVAKT
jgi:hypothetical protein